MTSHLDGAALTALMTTVLEPLSSPSRPYVIENTGTIWYTLISSCKYLFFPEEERCTYNHVCQLRSSDPLDQYAHAGRNPTPDSFFGKPFHKLASCICGARLSRRLSALSASRAAQISTARYKLSTRMAKLVACLKPAAPMLPMSAVP